MMRFENESGYNYSLIKNRNKKTLIDWRILALIILSLSFGFGQAAPSEGLSLQGITTIVGNILGLDFTQSAEMDGMKCAQKVICQAHHIKEGNKSGILASWIRREFPAPEFANPEESSPFEFAARAGKYNGSECGNFFPCILDLLGSARYIAHWLGHDILLTDDDGYKWQQTNRESLV